MKNRLVACIGLSLAVLLYSSKGNCQQAVQKIRLNPEAAIGGPASKFISKVNFIPLENTRQSQFERISQLEVTPTHFVVLSRSAANVVFVFTREGKFVSKIQGSEESHFTEFDRKNNWVKLMEYPVQFTYDLQGKLVKKETISESALPKGLSKAKLKEDYNAIVNWKIRNQRDSLIYQIMIYKESKLVGSYLPYPRSFVPEFDSEHAAVNFRGSFNGQPAGAVYTRKYDYTVYQVTTAGVVPVYQFLFPLKYSLPVDFMETSYNGKRSDFVIRKRLNGEELISRISPFYKLDNMIFFTTDLVNYAYDLQKGVLVRYDKIVPDSISNDLPIDEPVVIGVGADYLNKKYEFLQFDGTFFYTTVPAQVLFNAMESSKGKKKTVYSKELEAFFKNRKNSGGSPVLVQIEFKNGF